MWGKTPRIKKAWTKSVVMSFLRFLTQTTTSYKLYNTLHGGVSDKILEKMMLRLHQIRESKIPMRDSHIWHELNLTSWECWSLFASHSQVLMQFLRDRWIYYIATWWESMKNLILQNTLSSHFYFPSLLFVFMVTTAAMIVCRCH